MRISHAALVLAAFVVGTAAFGTVHNNREYNEAICYRQDCNKKNNCQCPSNVFSLGEYSKTSNFTKPQFVILSFDQSMTRSLYTRIYRQFNKEVVNPKTGCEWRATFFPTVEFSDFHAIHQLYKRGNEIGSGTTSSNNLNERNAKHEIRRARTLLSHYAHIPLRDIRGFRAPNNSPGGDEMMEEVVKAGFTYDSSYFSVKPIWPFNMKYTFRTCLTEPCPVLAYNKTIQFPSVRIENVDRKLQPTGEYCLKVSTCQFPRKGTEQNYLANVLVMQLNKAAKAGNVPLVISFSGTHFQDNKRSDLFLVNWVETLRTRFKRNLHFVTMNDVLEWMKNPVSDEEYTAREKKTCAWTKRKLAYRKKVRCSKRKVCHAGNGRARYTAAEVCANVSCPKRKVDLRIKLPKPFLFFKTKTKKKTKKN